MTLLPAHGAASPAWEFWHEQSFYKRPPTGEQWQSGDGGNPPGLRPLAVGRYVFRWLSEGDRRRIKRAMRAADGRYEGEILFGLLAEVDTGVPILPGERITDEHIALFLEYLGIARIHSEMDEPMWRSIRQLCVGDDRARPPGRCVRLRDGL